MCGHYEFVGVKASLVYQLLGAIDSWLYNRAPSHEEYFKVASDAIRLHIASTISSSEPKKAFLSVQVQDAWANDQVLAVHTWIYVET